MKDKLEDKKGYNWNFHWRNFFGNYATLLCLGVLPLVGCGITTTHVDMIRTLQEKDRLAHVRIRYYGAWGEFANPQTMTGASGGLGVKDIEADYVTHDPGEDAHFESKEVTEFKTDGVMTSETVRSTVIDVTGNKENDRTTITPTL